MFLGSLALRRFALDKFRPCPRDRAIAYLWPLLVAMMLIGVGMQLCGPASLVTAQTPPVVSYGSATPTGGVALDVTLESDVEYAFIRWDVWTATYGWTEGASSESWPVLLSRSGNSARFIAGQDFGTLQSQIRACYRNSESDPWLGCRAEDGAIGTNVRWLYGFEDSPAQVTGVTLEPASDSITVSWDAIADADEYKVQWGESGRPFQALDFGVTVRTNTVDGTATSYTIDGLDSVTDYIVRVVARKYGAISYGLGTVSATVAASTLPDIEPPAQVTGLAGTPYGRSIALTWNVATDAHAYRVEWHDPDGDFTAPDSDNSGVTSYVMTDLTVSTAYTIRVVSIAGECA